MVLSDSLLDMPPDSRSQIISLFTTTTHCTRIQNGRRKKIKKEIRRRKSFELALGITLRNWIVSLPKPPPKPPSQLTSFFFQVHRGNMRGLSQNSSSSSSLISCYLSLISIWIDTFAHAWSALPQCGLLLRLLPKLQPPHRTGT